LTNGTVYNFTVVATNAIGDSAPYTISLTPVTVPAPVNISGTADDSSVTLSWNLPSNGGSAITGYKVTSINGTIITTLTSISITGLINGTPYTFTVVATNEIGDSAVSSIILTPAYIPTPIGINWTPLDEDVAGRFISVACSSDFTRLMFIDSAASYPYLSIYINSTRTINYIATSLRCVATSSGGSKIIVCTNGVSGNIYISEDFGITWIPSTLNVSAWARVSASSDFTKLAAISISRIVISIDSGTSWVDSTIIGSPILNDIIISRDGSKIIVVSNSTLSLYITIDFGSNWTQSIIPGTAMISYVASSSNGTNLAVCTRDGFIYTSTDSGVTWEQRTSQRRWTGIVSSSDGSKLAAIVTPGFIYTSIDSGLTWTETNSGSRNWSCIAATPDCSKIVACVNNSITYIST
jgi:photosystem II stability/assembly factor-like uncharacterized protein